MKQFKQFIRAGIVAVIVFAATISASGTASAAPSGLTCYVGPFLPPTTTINVGGTLSCAFSGSATGSYVTGDLSAVSATRDFNGLNILYVNGESVGTATVCVTGGGFESCQTITVVQ
ncbi:MAG: hypothetical protein AAGF95_14600 [Chloroflexota bacterium]